jgi:hypothetical protein
MQPGGVAIRRSTLGMIGDTVLGTHGSPRYLYFLPNKDEDKAHSIDLANEAHYCRKCGVLVVQEERKEEPADDLACMSCGKPIPADAPRCPACGWSWSEA